MKLLRYNLGLVILPILIFSLGIITLLSTAPNLAKNQLIFFLLGVFIYFGVSQVDYIFFKYYWKFFYIGSLFLLLLTLVIGRKTYGSVRWIQTGLFNIQPSELAKIALLISLATVLSSVNFSAKKPLDLLKLVLLILPLLGFVFIQPDLGTTLILLFVFIGVLYYAQLSKLYFLFVFITVGIFSAPFWNFLADYQKERILVFINPALDLLGSGYNVVQSVIAVGAGRLLGRGFGRGTQSHLQFLPVFWTDFVFASFAEEWGFIGVMMLLTLFVLLFLTLIYIAYTIPDAFGSLLVIGTFVVFFSQFVINVGMNLGLMPVTGIPLPLVSYGGSSLISTFFLLGLVQSIWLKRKV